MDLDRAAELNRDNWDSVRRQRDLGLIPKHHDVAADILAGKSCLSQTQRELLGDVAGKRLLDLGCGDGCELLEWARAGADVVGVDVSPRQLEAARCAAERLGLSCRLVCADFLHLPEELLRGDFDVVFSDWTTAWIGDLDRWFSGVERALKQDGVFLLNGAHPLTGFIAERQRGEGRRPRYEDGGPFVETSDAVSAEWNPLGETQTTVEWRWTLGSLLTAIARAGLRITHVVEQGEELAQAKMGLAAGLPGEIVVRAVKD